ncbi:MAG: cache domain-containing protein [Campylobacterota bacterium]|nr:cache domain-containing protein [Campylobacterota bacterium]
MKHEMDKKRSEYIQKNKDEIYNKVHFVNNSIEFQISRIEEKIKRSLKYKLNSGAETARYSKVIENKIKNNVLKRFKNFHSNNNSYIFIYDLHNLDGGDDFSTMLLNPNRADLIGKKLTDNYRDEKGKYFRKEYLKGLKNKGEVYVQYYYKKPDTKEPKPKLSYFYLQKDWNWIIASGFYFDDLEDNILKTEQSIRKYTKELIIDSIFWISLLSFIAIMVAIYVSLKIDKTIKKQTDKLIQNKIELEIAHKNEYAKNEELKHKEKLAAMGEMIGNIAHQWRQPLNAIGAINMNIETKLEFGDTITVENYKTISDDINKQLQFMSTTIDNFRDFIKNNGRAESFNLKNNLDSFLSLIEGSIKTEDINIVLDLDKDIEVYSYPNELIQCYINIYNNSKDAIKHVSEKNKLLLISISIQNENIIIMFKDNAGGIPKDILNKIFEPYFTTKHKSQGTGLGLNMTYRLIVDEMDGTIQAQNIKFDYNGQKQTGASFIITLPNKQKVL